MASIFRRLLRTNATSVDRPGVDEVSPPIDREDVGGSVEWFIHEEHTPNRMGAQRGHVFRGSLVGPLVQIDPRPIIVPPDARPTPQVAHYGRARHGEGLFGLQPLIPEGETELSGDG